MIPMTLDDIADKMTILSLKLQRADLDPKLRQLYEDRVALYAQELQSSSPEVQAIVPELAFVNSQIWDAEAMIRAGQEHKMSNREMRDRCLQVRNLNRVRAQVKNKIVAITGEGVPDVKVNYANDD